MEGEDRPYLPSLEEGGQGNLQSHVAVWADMNEEGDQPSRTCVLQAYPPLDPAKHGLQVNPCCVHLRRGVVRFYLRCCVHDPFPDRKNYLPTD